MRWPPRGSRLRAYHQALTRCPGFRPASRRPGQGPISCVNPAGLLDSGQDIALDWLRVHEIRRALLQSALWLRDQR
jgi:hypothetical protein